MAKTNKNDKPAEAAPVLESEMVAEPPVDNPPVEPEPEQPSPEAKRIAAHIAHQEERFEMVALWLKNRFGKKTLSRREFTIRNMNADLLLRSSSIRKAD